MQQKACITSLSTAEQLDSVANLQKGALNAQQTAG
jgi:hypothetical protein